MKRYNLSNSSYNVRKEKFQCTIMDCAKVMGQQVDSYFRLVIH